MIRVDNFEPREIVDLLAQTVAVQRAPLNPAGFADYMWFAHDGHTVQVERKQWGEILSDLDGIEEQLRREIVQVDETYLLIEGVIDPTASGIDAYKKDSGARFSCIHSYGSRNKPNPAFYSRVQSWLWGLDKAGVTVWQSHTIAGTARVLSAFYQASQKQEHSVLTRYIRSKVTPVPWNQQVLILMGIKGVGEETAKTLISHFGTVGRLCSASPEEIATIPGLGMVTANKVLAALWEV